MPDRLPKLQAQIFFFAEATAYHTITERDPQNITLLLSMGEIPGGKKGQNAAKG